MKHVVHTTMFSSSSRAILDCYRNSGKRILYKGELCHVSYNDYNYSYTLTGTLAEPLTQKDLEKYL